MTYNEAKTLVDSIVIMREEVPDTLALKCKGIYPTFDSLCKKKFIAEKIGYKFRYKDNLYKTLQPNTTFVTHYAPGVGTESMFEKIDEAHAGTKEDPIPYSGNMRLEEGKFYSQNGIVYKCTRNTGNPVYNDLKDLVNNFVIISE